MSQADTRDIWAKKNGMIGEIGDGRREDNI